ncbi:MAG: hypothetical protein JNL83_14745 [Myxococcales bacterium]|nr:hypothetical protein [Myxococcales bacterium]
MKLVDLVTSLALLAGASTTVLANGESIPTRDPNQRPIAPRDCSDLFAGALYDECAGRVPASPPPASPPPASPPPARRVVPRPPPPAPPPSECGTYQLTLTAAQVFPELAGNLQRAATDLAVRRRQLATVQERHQRAADRVYRLSPAAGMPYDPVALDLAQRQLAAIADAELALRREIAAIERYRDQTARYLSNVGTQIVRDAGCVSLERAINLARARLGAPPL